MDELVFEYLYFEWNLGVNCFGMVWKENDFEVVGGGKVEKGNLFGCCIYFFCIFFDWGSVGLIDDC